MNLAAKIPRTPRHCVWEITTRCNLRCTHCELEAGERRPDEMSGDEALALAGDLASLGCSEVSLTGGEPLLRGDWADIAARLASRGIQVKVVTNGLLVDDEAVARMIEAGVTGVSVSLDGMREVHDAIRVPAARMSSRWDLALRAVDLLASSALRTAVITQVHRRNIDDLESMYELLVDHGVDAWQVQLTYPLGRLLSTGRDHLVRPADLPRLEALLAGLVTDGRVAVIPADSIGYYGRHEPVIRSAILGRNAFWTGCMAGCLGLCLCSNGDVKGCPSQPDAFVVGNALREPLEAIWGDADRFEYNTRWDESLLEGECAACPHRRLCRAGCTTMAYAVTGTIYDNPFCIQRAGK